MRLNPASQPMKGMMAWKLPKNPAMRRAWLSLKRLMAMPLVMDTAKASIANPNAMSTIAGMSIFVVRSYFAYFALEFFYDFFCVYGRYF